jgi:hypothetical protein
MSGSVERLSHRSKWKQHEEANRRAVVTENPAETGEEALWRLCFLIKSPLAQQRTGTAAYGIGNGRD